MRVMLAAMRCEKGDVAGNLRAHERVLDAARAACCRLAVFPEMSLTGSVDPNRRPEHLVTLGSEAVGRLAAGTGTTGVAAVFGIAERDPAGVPRISQVVAGAGTVLGVQRKRHLGEDEIAYSAVDEDAVFDLDGMRFAIAICAEGNVDRPFERAQAAGAHLVCYCAAPGLYGRRTDEAGWRAGSDWWEGESLGNARRQARERDLWVAIATQAGSTVDEDFPGLAALVDPRGAIVARLPDRHEGTLVVEVDA